MTSVSLRVSWVDLRRRKARSFFTIATIAAAVSSISLFALGPLMDRAMLARVDRDRAFELQLSTRDAVLSDAQIAAMRTLPNVRDLDARTIFSTRMWIGDRRENVLLYGVDDFAHQRVDIVSRTSGREPGAMEVLTDPQNAGRGIFGAGSGAAAAVIDASGSTQPLTIAGTASTVAASQSALGTNEDTVVLYATGETVRRLGGYRGIDSLELLLVKNDKASVDATIAAVRATLANGDPPVVFSQLPFRRAPGSWGPGQEAFSNIASVFVIIAVLALVSALFLITNTMNTIVGEQQRQIGIMKAIGGRRRQVAFVYLRMGLLLGLAGAAIGSVLGIALSNLLVRYVGSQLFSVTPGFGIDWAVTAVSAGVGVAASLLASIPALVRAMRMPVVDALHDAGVTSSYGNGRVDRALQHATLLPRTSLIGIRGIARQKGRSATTTIQIALAVANLLGVLGLGASVVKLTNAAWDANTFDILAIAPANENRLDAHAAQLASTVEGVAAVEPLIMTTAEVRGKTVELWGMTGDATMFHRDAMAGRWFDAADEAAQRNVVVISRYFAESRGVHVGQSLTVQTATGPADFEIVAVDRNQVFNGELLVVPLATLRSVLRQPEGATELWLATRASDHPSIDRVTTRVEDVLSQNGYPVGTGIRYVMRDRNASQNGQIVNIILVVGLLVVAISMVGLVNTTTMNILERTREIGILRCIGARARDVRLVFGSEGLTLALLGWAVGVPLGYAFDAAMVRLVDGIFHVYLPVLFPPLYVLIAFVGTIVLALVTMLLPLRRATRLHPGDALRYQ